MANIGRLALTVTANAAPALADLSNVEKKTAATGKAIEKNLNAGGEGGAGLTGFLGGIAGGAIVAGLSAAAQGVGKLAGMMVDARKNAAALGQQFNAVDSKSLDRVDAALHGVQSAVAGTFAKLVASAEPAITAIASVFVDLLAKAEPVLRWLVDKGAVALSLGFQAAAAVLKVLGSEVMRFWDSFAGASGIADWFNSWPDWSSAVTAALRGMAKGFAYVWDAAKTSLGFVVTVAGEATEKIVLAVKALSKVKSLAPTIAGPLGVLAQNLSEAQLEQLDKIATAAKATGWQMMTSAGQTAKAFEQALKGIKATLDDPKFTPKFVAYQPSAALLKGSAAEYSVRARFEMEDKLNPQLDAQKQQLAEQRKATEVLMGIRDAVRNIRPVELGVF